MDFVALVAWLQHYSLVFATVLFVLIVATTYWPGRKPGFDRQARIPLDDER